MNRISRSISLLLSDWFPSRIDPSHLMEMILSSREITKNSHTQQWPSLIALLAERRKLTADWPLPLSIVGPALAWVDESAYRSIGIRLYPVQFLAAYAILSGHIAEMKTGEGKTYAGVAAAMVASLGGQGVHFMTTNDYLAKRDSEIATKILRPLGISVGYLDRDSNLSQKQIAYQADVTYGPGYEFGFDYLRDQTGLRRYSRAELGSSWLRSLSRPALSQPAAATLQHGHAVAIIDEADSVMIDEATTPLVLSGSAAGPHPDPFAFQQADRVAKGLVCGVHFHIDPLSRSIALSRKGIEAIGCLPKHDAPNTQKKLSARLARPWTRYVENALQAHHEFRRDVRYVVIDNKIQLVDTNTGRILPDRTWNDGLHQAVEVKENVTVTCENVSIGRISRQQYFALYDRIGGMTGTAAESQSELANVYGLKVWAIPTHRECQRDELPLRVFATADKKFQAIMESVMQHHSMGRPVLVGTRTINVSQTIARRLHEKDPRLEVQILNGLQDQAEAEIVAKAGNASAITIATNMAGRGTDIAIDPQIDLIGGLHVIVAEMNDSRRVDRQLIGRAARQGNRGSSQIFVCGEDTLIAHHAPWMAKHFARMANSNGEVITSVQKDLDRLQSRLERKFSKDRQNRFAFQKYREDTLKRFAGCSVTG
jgi:preprotein translocase subunit SecA